MDYSELGERLREAGEAAVEGINEFTLSLMLGFHHQVDNQMYGNILSLGIPYKLWRVRGLTPDPRRQVVREKEGEKDDGSPG